jgi:hypothetical protein
MKKHGRRGMLCVLGAVALAAAALAPITHAAGRVERIGPFTGSVPAWVTPQLEAQGYRVALSDGTVVGDIWFRKDLPGLKPATLVGVMTFAAPATDFRKQAIKPGTYTLRYAEMPNDGDHLGAAPTSTFLLLSPAALDVRAADDLTFKELTKMSARTNGTNHPSPLYLADVSAQKEFPAIGTNQYGHEVFYVKLKTASGAELPIGLVVKGQTEHEV